MVRIVIVAIPPRVVVIVENEKRLLPLNLRLGLVDPLAEHIHIEAIDKPDLHIHGQIEFVVVRTVHFAQIVDRAQIRLADQHHLAPMRLIRNLPQFA